ncbi:hypothetical protein [Paludibaculum fermentans]|uniref:Uncharacterized protein n=1 Tax=Paludibaculum fermentans TaxID=1473598 RepID=A0A7S7NPM7_PALFE|nr:hypothetical protein [Paludibaculum fermentans]QOY86969.1 hypothetical protein IRI77_30005 [Paludibaculum fermentans]
MKRVLLIAVLVLAGGGVSDLMRGQSPNPAPHGTNYDPPIVARPKDPAPPPPPPPEEPLFSLQDIDLDKSDTWVKMALLMGSIVLALRAFRQMRGD